VAHADLHALDWRALGLDEVVPIPGADPAGHETDRWMAYADEQALDAQPELVAVYYWLRHHRPEPSGEALVHGDYRPGNSLVRNDDDIMILDWELAHVGDPAEDLGWWAAPVFRAQHTLTGAFEIEDLLQRYETYSGREVDRAAVHFWSVLAVFKLAGMVLTGNRSFCERRSERATAGGLALQDLLFKMTGL
jgi:aminoglycoside phosphotransferase (APT) family kinase protein